MAGKVYEWVPKFDCLKNVGDFFEISKDPVSNMSFTAMIGTIQAAHRHYCQRRNIVQTVSTMRMNGTKVRVTRIK